MAIIKHLEVTILVNDEVAAEFSDEESQEQAGANTTTKYIEVKSGARFAFRCKVLPSYQPGEEDGFSFKIYIDGQSATGIVCRKEEVNPVTGWTAIRESRYIGSGSDLKRLVFTFADLKTRDTCEADLAILKDKYNELGFLVVKVDPVRLHGYIEPPPSKYRASNEEVPEKALKGRAIAVTTKMDEAPMNGQPAPRTIDARKIGKESVAVFSFKYRTRAALQSEMIIPRSPSPIDLEETAVEDLTPEEMRELIRRQRERVVKIEDENIPSIKRERPLSSIVPLRPLKCTKTSEGKTVYHLESDDEEGEEEDRSVTIEQEPKSIEIIEL